MSLGPIYGFISPSGLAAELLNVSSFDALRELGP
ncbi:hypothetical protein ACP4OV_004179 [Aristida adscensionis]